VFEELKAGGLGGHTRQAMTGGWIQLVRPESGRESTLYREYSRTLGSGESASLAIAIVGAGPSPPMTERLGQPPGPQA
jgi:hypothetical protein